MSNLKRKELALLEVREGLSILDAGCGRGEVLLACASEGANVTGIDYSVAAVEISKETLSEVDGAVVTRADITSLPFDTSTFDRVLFGDVIEHIDCDQTAQALGEIHRVLRPGGKLVLHTSPNLLFLKLAWPLARVGLKAIGRGESARNLDGWIAESKEVHVNEQSVFSLRKHLKKANYADINVWVDRDVLRSGQHHLTEGLGFGSSAMEFAARAMGTRPLRTILGNDLYATASKPTHSM